MRTKFALAATVAALFLTTGLAEAQQSAPPANSNSGTRTQSMPSTTPGSSTDRMAKPQDHSTLHEIKDDDTMAQGLKINAKDLRAMAIYGSDGKKVGDVDNVLADTSNVIKAVTVDVGGFLGMGSKEVVIPIDKLRKGSEDKRLQTAMTKTEIENLGEWSATERGATTGRSSTNGAAPNGTAPSTTPSSR